MSCKKPNTSDNDRLHRYLRPLLFAGIVVGLSAAWFAGCDSYIRNPQKIVDTVTSGGWGAATVFCIAFVSGGSLGVPPAIFVVAAGLLWPFWPALGLSLAGGMAAAAFGYLLSRYIARDFCQRHIPRRVRRYNEQLRQQGLKTVIMLRLVFYLFPPVSWMIGLSRIRVRDYFLGTLIGALPGTVLYTLVGDGWIPWLVKQPPGVIATIIGGILLVISGVFVLHWQFVKIRKRSTPEVEVATVANQPQTKMRANASPVSFSLFLKSAWTFCRLGVRAFFPPPPYRKPPAPKRCAVLLLFLPAFGLLQLMHWVAFWCDEFLFPGYRRIAPEAPLFVVGIPRSGTTFLHRVLARDDAAFTTFELWQLLFAPAICERKCLLAVARLDRRLGAPFGRLLNWGVRFFTGGLDDVHKLSLREPEEDFLLLMPILACYILVVVFPFAPEIQNLCKFDVAFSDKDRKRVMAFYRAMLQRHLYVEGNDRVILSKNVSFTPMLKSLTETFPECRIVACVRAPNEAVASQVSAMEASWRAFGIEMKPQVFQERWIELMKHYYKYLGNILTRLAPQRTFCLEMKTLRENTAKAVHDIYHHFGYSMSKDFAGKLREQSRVSRGYRSRHDYSLAEYGISEKTIGAEFTASWQVLKGKARNQNTNGRD